jgi:tyrosine-protein phosphatase YwqE
VDDGAASTSILSKEVKKSGLEKIIYTPRYISGSYENDNLKKNFELLKRILF